MTTFSRYVRDTMPLKRYLIEGVVLMLAVSGIQLLLPQFIRTMLDDFIPHSKVREAFIFFILILVAYAIRGFLTVRRNQQMLRFGYGFIYDLRLRLMRQLQLLSSRYYDHTPMGDVMTRMLDDVMNVENMTTNSLLNLVTDLVVVAGVLVMLFSMSVPLTIASLSIMPLYYLNFRHFRPLLRKKNREIQKNYSELSSEFSEAVAGVRVIKSFALEKHKGEKFKSFLDADMEMRISTYTKNAVFQVTGEFLTILGTVLVLFYGGWLVMKSTMSIGEVVAFYTYVGFLYQPLMRFVGMVQVVQRGLASIERIYEVLDTTPNPEEKKDALELESVKGHVEFSNVRFAYEGSEEAAVNDATFSIKPGKTVALVGMSGAGKTTIVNLMMRFYDPINGTIKLDGHDLRDIKIESLRSNCALVLQEGFLFSGTVYDNIRMGRLSATDEEVVAAAKAACANEFIESMPEGYLTLIGEKGRNLSGGQKQLIALARAMLRKAPIVILDEPTSAMDSETEHWVRLSIEQLTKNSSTLIIAHRLSTIQRADEILVMKKGRIAERGRHEELLEQNGYYKKLFHLQFEHRPGKAAHLHI
ncbi:MAG: ABC transporter ATP-binding protein [Fibrobacteres bacterium]|nr:ABC transporter ATP-binding protein [Fibrobacterota bacterium]